MLTTIEQVPTAKEMNRAGSIAPEHVALFRFSFGVNAPRVIFLEEEGRLYMECIQYSRQDKGESEEKESNCQ